MIPVQPKILFKSSISCCQSKEIVAIVIVTLLSFIQIFQWVIFILSSIDNEIKTKKQFLVLLIPMGWLIIVYDFVIKAVTKYEKMRK